jgi:drug/metabolite transporter (DMT)-like permease
MKALELGPASLTSPLMNLNIVFVMILSTFNYHEPLSLLKAFGAFLLILAASLFAVRVKEPLSIREINGSCSLSSEVFYYSCAAAG